MPALALTARLRLSSRAGLAMRAAFVALTLLLERIALGLLVHASGIPQSVGIGDAFSLAQHWRFPFLVTFATSLGALWYMRRDPVIDAAARAEPLRPRWLVVHGALVLALLPLLRRMYGGGAKPDDLLTVLALLVSAGAVLALLTATASWTLWRRGARSLGIRWLYAALAAVVAALSMQWSQQLWSPATNVTFALVRLTLAPLVPGLQSDSAERILYTDSFAVQINELCSGLEGAGLMLAFCCAWLVYFRREYVFPRALVLIPAALTLIFILNVLRIAALVLIGHAGFADVAVNGFHSHAGWIAFNCAACGIAFASRHSTWLTRADSRPAAGVETENPTASYLLPFLAILASGMIARAVSDGFETWYALRLIAALVALRYCWPRLRTLDWRSSWRGPAVGLAIFVLWMLSAHLLTVPVAMPPALATMPVTARVAWLAARVAAAVITVPIAEELAYRGFLLRRVVSADFEAVRFADVGYLPLLVSAVVFGLGHGSMWLPGIVSGVAYGAVLVRTGRIGEAVCAHAVTNLLIAVSVLGWSQWQLW
jgi:exosortase E/protease (VPEID-CTERM system)